MEEIEEILDDNINSEIPQSDYDLTNEFDEGYSKERITFKSLFLFVLSVLNFEKGILFTIKELIVRPKAVIEEYLKKDRKKLVNPIRFLVFSTAFATFLTIYFVKSNVGTETLESTLSEGFSIGLDESVENDSIEFQSSRLESIDTAKLSMRKLKRQKSKEAMSELGKIMSESNDKFTFAVIFFFAFSSLLLFKSNGYNYTENLVINVFMVSMMNVISIIGMIPSILFSSSIFIIIASILSFIFTIYYWMMVYKRKSVGGFFRCIMNYVFGYGLFSILLLIIIVAYIFVKAGL